MYENTELFKRLNDAIKLEKYAVEKNIFIENNPDRQTIAKLLLKYYSVELKLQSDTFNYYEVLIVS